MTIMIEIKVPGFADITLRQLVADYNGTLAVDGVLIPGVSELIFELADKLDIHIITADTFGLAREQLAHLPITLTIAALENQDQEKLSFIEGLGASSTVAIGNGRNDRCMLKAAALGIALIQKEGASIASVSEADVVCTSIHDAIGLIQNPSRIIATLRS